MSAKIPAEGIPYLVFYDQLILETSFVHDGHYWLGYNTPVSYAPYIYFDDYLLEHYEPEDYIVRTPAYAQNLKSQLTIAKNKRITPAYAGTF